MPPDGEAAYRGTAHRWLEWFLMAFGLACLLFYAFFAAQTAIYQRQAKSEIDRMISERNRPAAPPSTASPAPPAAVAPESPTMSRRAPGVPGPAPLARGMAEGDDDSTLGKAVGHLPDTPLPWQTTGNAAFAAHRDGLFRPLRDIRVNDEVRIVTPRGEFLYRVKKTQIVDPEDVWVLAPTKTPTLTLITCYPFSFVGHAPQRFIVQAERAEPDPPGVAFKGTVLR